MAELKVCLIGCGDIFEKSHLEHWTNTPDAYIYSVVDIDEGRARRGMELSGAERRYADYRDALEEDVDIVDVCLPHHLHTTPTIDACRAGKHVLCEKPMTMAVSDADAMCRAAEENGVKLSIRHTLRYAPIHQEMKRRIAGGEVGTPYFGSCDMSGYITNERLAEYPYWYWLERRASGGGVLGAMGVHGIDVMLWMMAGRVRYACGVAASEMLEEDADVEDTAIAVAKLADGGVLRVTASWKRRRGDREPTEVHGKEGSLIARGDGLTLVRKDGSEEMCPVPPVERTITDDFVQAVLEDTEPPAPGHEVIESVKVLEGCHRTMLQDTD